MWKFITRRLLSIVPVLFGLSIVLFAFIHLLPGDPAEALLGDKVTPERAALLRAQLGLDEPLFVQYIRYISSLFHGDFGSSVINNRSVLSEVLRRFPVTITLTTAAILLAVLGVLVGRYAARHSYTARDATVTVVSLLGASVPIFVFGYFLQIVFGVQLGWLPTGGVLDSRLQLQVPSVTNFVLVDSLLAGRLDAFVDALRHLILPALVLSAYPFAVITRITRGSILDVSSEDFVRTARAKGLTEARVDRRHIMRNAWLPVTTIVGVQAGLLLSGAVITETVFSLNGVGSYVVRAIQTHDYLVVQSMILLFALVFIVVNLIVDIVYALLDPRIRHS
jgi:peptide/nickel transport system permease protein